MAEETRKIRIRVPVSLEEFNKIDSSRRQLNTTWHEFGLAALRGMVGEQATPTPKKQLKTKHLSRAKRLSQALGSIEDGLSEIESLKAELENWRDGMSGTNLENTNKYSQLEEAISSLGSGYDGIESGKADLEGVEFPGMFG